MLNMHGTNNKTLKLPSKLLELNNPQPTNPRKILLCIKKYNSRKLLSFFVLLLI